MNTFIEIEQRNDQVYEAIQSIKLVITYDITKQIAD